MQLLATHETNIKNRMLRLYTDMLIIIIKIVLSAYRHPLYATSVLLQTAKQRARAKHKCNKRLRVHFRSGSWHHEITEYGKYDTGRDEHRCVPSAARSLIRHQ